MKYYRKEIPTQAVYIFGQPFRFDFFATEDQALIHELDKCIRKQMGGVIGITKEEYDAELKKKEIEQQLSASSNSPQQRQELRALNRPPQPERRAVEVVANPGGRRNGMFARQQMWDRGGISAHQGGDGRNGPMPDPIQIPSPAQFALPPTAKLSEVAK